MKQNLAPTKANLIKVKGLLEFSRKGFELLDKKRNILIREIMSLVESAENIQKDVISEFEKGYAELQATNITMGIKNVEDIAHSIPKTEEYEILYKSVMGVEIPIVNYEKREVKPTYGFYRTNTGFDRSVKQFRKIRYLIYDLAEIETRVYRLAMEIKKTQKRTNALENIIIPRYKAEYKRISETLEEKEREDFFRLKKVKSKNVK